MSGRNLEESRGLPRVAGLYNLESDIGEERDLSGEHPEIVERMTGELTALIERGSSREVETGGNDTRVRFDTIQERQWAPAAE